MGYRLNYQEQGSKNIDFSEGFVSIPRDPILKGLSLRLYRSKINLLINSGENKSKKQILNAIDTLLNTRKQFDNLDVNVRKCLDKELGVDKEVSDEVRFSLLTVKLLKLRAEIVESLK